MKKALYILTLFCLVNLFPSHAQTFDWVTNDTIATNLAQNTTVQLKMEQSVIGPDTITLGVEIIYNDLPASWDGMVCIHGSCFGVIPVVGTTSTMSPIYDTINGYTRLTVNPLDGTEAAKLQIYVYDVNFPMDGDTATWLLNETLSFDDLSFEKPAIFPNPAVDQIEFSSEQNIESVDVYTSTGILVERLSVEKMSGTSIDVKELESGMYILRFTDDKGITATSKFRKL